MMSMNTTVHKRGISELSGSHYNFQAHGTYLYSTGPPVSICMSLLFFNKTIAMTMMKLQQTSIRGQGCDVGVAEDGGVCDQGGGITCV